MTHRLERSTYNGTFFLFFSQMIQEGNHAVLLIKTTYPEDSGVYTCRATNPASQVESSAYLTVHSKP